MTKKYLILDFGKVLAKPTTGNWFITPKFLELIDINLVDMEKLDLAFKKYNYIISRKAVNEKEEYNMFFEFYDKVLKEIAYQKYNQQIIKQIAYNFTYENDKYIFYKGIKEELEKLSKKYKLILLSDNWPCALRIMKDINIYHYFEKIYISSIYDCQKKDKVFFDYPIKDFNIKKEEAIFIDDNESLLDIAIEKELSVKLMDRAKSINNSKYEIIHDLINL